MAKERQYSWSTYLDAEKQDRIFGRYVFTADFQEVEEFAVIYFTMAGGRSVEVIRYDCCGGEAVNVHRFYRYPPKKVFLNRQNCFDTILEFIRDIEKNWRVYKARFFEK